MNYENTLEFAQKMDEQDPLSGYREQFHIPQINDQDCLYFTGNSLGLQPKNTRQAVNNVLDKWATEGVEGHFTGQDQWFDYHKINKQPLAKIVGAKESEVILMNSLTVNLHLLMVSFYQPNTQRYKIIMETGAFPSDQYAVESQVKFHGHDPEDAIIELIPREGEHILHTEDIINTIENNADSVALVLIGGVQYFTGQYFELDKITEAGHAIGAMVGIDLAHAAGNVPLQLHDWGIDFATWCSYKYLNGGPGNLSGAFVHEKHESNQELPRFAGWWGHDEGERFQMKKGFVPMKGVDGWQLSNTNIIAAATVNASLEIFDKAGIENLRIKSKHLTGFAEYLLKELSAEIEVITPANADHRGCQLSIQLNDNGQDIFNYLHSQGVIADWREANQENEKAGIIRIAPVPLYNRFTDVFQFAQILKSALLKYNG